MSTSCTVRGGDHLSAGIGLVSSILFSTAYSTAALKIFRRRFTTLDAARVPCSFTVLLGDSGQAGSTRLRDCARQELNGYASEDDLPDYRQIPAPLIMRITNAVGYGLLHQELQTGRPLMNCQNVTGRVPGL